MNLKDFNWRYISPYAGVFIVVVFVTLYENLTGIIHPDALVMRPELAVPEGTEAIAGEMNTRIEWAIISVLWWLVGLFSIGTSMLIILYQSRGLSKSSRSLLIGIPFVVSILILLVMSILRKPGGMDMMASGLTLFALDYSVLTGNEIGPLTVEKAIDLMGILATLTIILGCGAFASLLVKDSTISTEYLLSLQSRIQRVRFVIITSSIAFIVGSTTISALYKWAATLGATSLDVTMLEQVAKSASALSGFVFSAIIAGMYIPTMLLLRKEVNELVLLEEKKNSDWTASDKNDWLDKHNLKFEYTSELTNVLTLAAPFLSTGPLNQILSLIGIG